MSGPASSSTGSASFNTRGARASFNAPQMGAPQVQRGAPQMGSTQMQMGAPQMQMNGPQMGAPPASFATAVSASMNAPQMGATQMQAGTPPVQMGASSSMNAPQMGARQQTQIQMGAPQMQMGAPQMQRVAPQMQMGAPQMQMTQMEMQMMQMREAQMQNGAPQMGGSRAFAAGSASMNVPLMGGAPAFTASGSSSVSSSSAPTIDCSVHTSPCDCWENGACGWSSGQETCVSSSVSQTDCNECPRLCRAIHIHAGTPASVMRTLGM
jgi:hypothetical protein